MKTPTYLALKAMVDMMENGDEAGVGSSWYNAAVAALKLEEVQPLEQFVVAYVPTRGQIKEWIELSTIEWYLGKECLATIAFQNGAKQALSDVCFEAKRGEVVVTWSQDGQIQAVTRQDEEGKILSVIAESKELEQLSALTRTQIDHLAEDGCFLGNIYEITEAIEQHHNIGRNK